MITRPPPPSDLHALSFSWSSFSSSSSSSSFSPSPSSSSSPSSLELDALKQCNHPHIVRYHDSFRLESPPRLCYRLEFCAGGTLEKLFKEERRRAGLPASRVGEILRQLASALGYMHEQLGLIHRDLRMDQVHEG